MIRYVIKKIGLYILLVCGLLLTVGIFYPYPTFLFVLDMLGMIHTSHIIASKEFNVGKPGLKEKLEFTHPHGGTYYFGVEFTGNLSPEFRGADRYRQKIRLKILCYSGNKLAFSYYTRQGFWESHCGRPEPGEYCYNMALAFYEVPGQMPLNVPVSCEVKLAEADEYLQDKYGPTRLIVKHHSIFP